MGVDRGEKVCIRTIHCAGQLSFPVICLRRCLPVHLFHRFEYPFQGLTLPWKEEVAFHVFALWYKFPVDLSSSGIHFRIDSLA